MKFQFFLILWLALVLMSCTQSDSEKDPDASSDTQETESVNKPWERIEWKTADDGKYVEFAYNGLQPSCTNAPGTDPEFAFFFREGISNNLVVYFQGGGACWHENNTITQKTCTQELTDFENTDTFDLVGAGKGVLLGAGGIFDFTKSENPFKDWSFIYIPYCSGDLFWGAKDNEYSSTVRHRGHVNTRVVIEWMKNKFQTQPDNIFLTGISAGSYGAVFNFPFIKEEFSDSQFHVFADAGNGVMNADFKSSGLVNWGIQLPTSSKLPVTSTFTDLDDLEVSDLEIASLYATIANHYSTTKFAQYTTAWDNSQTYYYNVMENIENPDVWSDITSDTSIWCDWHDAMLVNVAATESLSDVGNFKYYIAPGEGHTILGSPGMYTETSNNVGLLDWINAMLTNGNDFDNVMCVDDCDKPVACPDC